MTPKRFGPLTGALRGLAAWSVRHPVVSLVIVCAVLYAPSLFTRDLWNPDEPRYRQIVSEMVAARDPLVLHRNGVLYAEKPPLFFWIASLVSLPFGDAWTTSTRFISALASMGTVLLTWRLGVTLLGRGRGFIAGLIAATAFLFCATAQTGGLDALITCLTTAAIICFLNAQESPEARARRRSYVWGGIWVILAVLTKGPVGMIIPCLSAIVVGVVRHGWREARIGPILLCGLLALLPVALWVYAGSVSLSATAGPEEGAAYLHRMFFQQNTGRAVDSFSHRQPWFYFLWNFPLGFLPWILLIPSALLRRVNRDSWSWKSRQICLLWFLAILLFFSAMSGKRPAYILPLYPAAALLIAGGLVKERAGVERQRGITIARWIQGVVWIVAGMVLAVAPFVTGRIIGLLDAQYAADVREMLAIMGGVRFAFAPLGVVILCFGLLSCAQPATAGLFRLTGLFAAPVCALALGVNILGLPSMNHFKSGRYLVEEFTARAKAEDQLVLYKDEFDGAYNIYTKRVVLPRANGPVELKALIGKTAGRTFVLGRQKEIDKELSGLVDTVAVEPLGHKKMELCVIRTGS